MKQLLWTALYQLIDLLQALFKDYVVNKHPEKDAFTNIER